MVFDYSVDNNQDIHIFSLRGELIEQAQSAPMMYEIERFISKHENKFILNLSDLKYINSSGLNVLIKILTKSRKSGGDLAIINVSPRINDLLVITKLSGIFNVCENMEMAISKLTAKAV